MSRQRLRARQLRTIEDIRELQRLRAQGEAQTAHRAADAAVDTLRSQEDEQAARQDAWRDSVAATRYDPILTGLWRAALLEGDRLCTVARGDVAVAELARNDAMRGLAHADAHKRAAQDIARTARRGAQRKADEALVAEVEDRFASRRRPV